MNQKINLLLALSLTLSGVAFADNDSTKTAPSLQEQITTTDAKIDGLNEDYLATKATVDGLSKLKFGGYIQAQWQHADTNGAQAGTVDGGAFPGNTNQRLQLRRVRLKATYDGGTSKYIMEMEARPSASNELSNSAGPNFIPTGVSLIDAEVQLTEPWLKTFALNIGLQDRAFGFEIPYSSSLHEAPERSRGEQIVFNGEKDLGVVLGINPTEKMGLLQYLNFKGGLYTGTAGYNGFKGDEIDSTMDIIGRLGFKAPFNDLNLEIDGGVSYYGGKVLGTNDSLYVMKGKALMLDSVGTALNKHSSKTLDRSVIGADVETYFTIPVLGDIIGGSSVRFEYMSGTTIGTTASSAPYGNQPGTLGFPATSTSKTTSTLTATDTLVTTTTSVTTKTFQPPMAQRKFSSWYVTYVQNLGPKFQSVVRYDVYDPNTAVKGSDVGVATNGSLTAGDLQYSDLGLGLVYFWDSNVKITAYYDMITNETAGGTANKVAANWGKDLPDNVLTVRAQVKF